MNSPEKTARVVRSTAFARNVRQRVSDIPERAFIPGPASAHLLNGFSIARIYTTFRLKRDEYFPVELDDAAFEVLIDLYLFEWLNGRAGSQQGAGMRLAPDAAMPSGAAALVAADLACVSESDEADGRRTINLSRAGRARLNIFFDYMATYISAM